MSAAWDGDRLVAEVRRLGLRGLQRDEYNRELGARLRRAMPFDAACWHALDPRTLLLTTVNPEELHAFGFLDEQSESHAARTFIASEYERPDYNAFATLARRRVPVGILSEATRGRPERSARYAEWLSGMGTPFELRAALVTRGRAWGCVVFHRTADSGDFTRADAQLMARLSKPIAEGLRASIRADAARRGHGVAAPGMIVLDRRDEIELITPPAEVLLDSLRDEAAASATLPMPVCAVAATARRYARHGEAAALHVPTRAGWLTLHASPADAGGSGRVAIVLQATTGEQAAPLRLEAYGLTARERGIAGLVAGGLSTEEMAGRLFLSPWTVQDHLKAIFEKTGTRSRRELRARIFHDEYFPALAGGAPLDADGALVR